MENKIIECLVDRRSVRAYSSKQISEEQLEQILQAGMYAPSGMGRQPCVMVAVQDPETVRLLSRLNARVLGSEGTDPFYGAPTVIVVLADKSSFTYLEDGSLVMGNLMNAAHAIGVDSCWIHRAKETFESKEGKDLLKKWGISGDYVGIGNCILGYRSGPYPTARQRKSNFIYRV